MRVCFAVLHYDPRVAGPDVAAYLDRVPLHRELPRELAVRGHEVHLVHLYPTSQRYVENDVTYHFAASPAAVRQVVGLLGRARGRDPAIYEPAFRAVKLIRDLRPDVVHFHGLTLTWNLFLASNALRATPLLLHYHGGLPPRNPLARHALRFTYERAARFLFTTRDQSEPFVQAGLLRDDGRVVELGETSSTFRRLDRALARRVTGMRGDPVFVWTGRLHPIKDPVSALLGFEKILAAWPTTELYLHYLTDELLPELRSFVESREHLGGHVHFRGRAAPDQMEAIYNSADFFLQGSRREVCGTSLLEAMACGTIPIVTDIPPFRAMTAGGRFGRLFTPGDPESLARAALSVAREEIEPTSRDLRDHFERELSFSALGEKLDRIYRAIAPGPLVSSPQRHQHDRSADDPTGQLRPYRAVGSVGGNEERRAEDERDEAGRVGDGEQLRAFVVEGE